MGKVSDDDTKVVLRKLALCFPAFWGLYYAVAAILCAAFGLFDAGDGSGAAAEPVFGKMPFNFELLEDFSFSEKEKAGARRARPRALRRVIALFRPLCAAC